MSVRLVGVAFVQFIVAVPLVVYAVWLTFPNSALTLNVVIAAPV